MCGRFSLYNIGDLMKWLHGLNQLPPLRPRYNIAPTDIIPIARQLEEAPAGVREIAPARWGYLPHWVKEANEVSLLINARSETLADKPAFRGALRHRRCLVPADGFFEWETTKAGKRPFHFRMADHSLFAFAGLWSRWQGAGGRILDTCAILTTEPNALVAPVHDRMPVILPKDHYDIWLDPREQDDKAMQRLLAAYPADQMESYPVTPRVNKTDFDEPAAVTPGGQQALF